MSRDHQVCAQCGILLNCNNMGIAIDSEDECSEPKSFDTHVSMFEACDCLIEKPINVSNLDLEAGLAKDQIPYVKNCIKLRELMEKEIVIAKEDIKYREQGDVVYTKVLVIMLQNYLEKSKK